MANFAAGISALTTASTDNFEATSVIAAGVVANNVAARLMTNPRFAKWLASSISIKASRLLPHSTKLATVVENQQDAEDIREYLQATQGQAAGK